MLRLLRKKDKVLDLRKESNRRSRSDEKIMSALDNTCNGYRREIAYSSVSLWSHRGPSPICFEYHDILLPDTVFLVSLALACFCLILRSRISRL